MLPCWQKAGGSLERLPFLRSAYRLTAYCPLLFAFHLFTPQRHHRIHLHRPPSGDITGQQRHAEQKRRRDCECQRVGRPDLEEQRFEEAGESACAFSFHSLLNAIIGSTFVARRAGIQQATSATTTNRTVTAVNVGGSVGLTLKSKALIRRVSP